MFRYLLAMPLLALPILAAQTERGQDRKELIAMHEKMAERHKVAADCLKANKPIDKCNREAMKGCPMMKSGMCPFMGEGGMMGNMEKKKGGHEHMKGEEDGATREKK